MQDFDALDIVQLVPLSLVDIDEGSRRYYDPLLLAELAESIRTQGLLQPVVVQYVGEAERFRVVTGARRTMAMRLLGEERIPAIIANPSNLDRLLAQLHENEARADYTDLERAVVYEKLRDMLGCTWDELAERVGLTKGRIHQVRRIKNRLAPAVAEAISRGTLTGTHGLYLAPLPTETQEELARIVEETGLTHAETKEVVRMVTKEGVELAPAVETVTRAHSAARKLRSVARTLHKLAPEISPDTDSRDALAELEASVAELRARLIAAV